jgi:DNA-directed RNA polymerase specialized sigma24 family protein
LVREWNAADLNRLLDWLSPDRNEAWNRVYEGKRKVETYVATRGHGSVAEEAADEALRRFAAKLPDLDITPGAFHPYLLGIAKNVVFELERKEWLPLEIDPPSPQSAPAPSLMEVCLKNCLAEMHPQERDLILEYYRGLGGEKIRRHKEMAEALGLTENAFRVRIHRVREALKHCCDECLKKCVMKRDSRSRRDSQSPGQVNHERR